VYIKAIISFSRLFFAKSILRGDIANGQNPAGSAGSSREHLLFK